MSFNSLLELFLSLSKIDSPSGYEAFFLEYVEKILTDLGFYIIYDNYGNLIAKSQEALYSDKKKYLFAFHADKVSTGNKIIPIVENGYITSKSDNTIGADNKASLACFLWELITNGSHYPIEIVITRMEEEGFIGARNIDISMLESRHGFIFDGGDIGDITVSSYYWTKLIIKKQKQYLKNIDHRLNDFIVPDLIKRIDFAYDKFLYFNIFSYKSTIMSWINNFFNNYGINSCYQIIRKCPGYCVNPDDMIIKLAHQSMMEIGVTPGIKDSLIGNEACIYNSKGIKMINIGDGVENPHEIGEKISVANLHILSNIIRSILSRTVD